MKKIILTSLLALGLAVSANAACEDAIDFQDLDLSVNSSLVTEQTVVVSASTADSASKINLNEEEIGILY